MNYNLLGMIDQAEGKGSDALRHYTRALEIRREQNDRRGCVAILDNMANLHTTMGNLRAAAAACSETLQLAHEIAYPTGYEWGFGEAVLILAETQPEATARLFGAIDRLHTTFALTVWPGLESDRAAAANRARQTLGDPAYTAAFEQGRELTTDAAVAEALAALATIAA